MLVLRPGQGRRRRGRAVRRGAGRRRARPTDRGGDRELRRRLRAVHAARCSTSTTSSALLESGTNVVTTRGELFGGGHRLGDDRRAGSLDACARGCVVDLRDRQQPRVHHRRAAVRAAVAAAPRRRDRDRGVREPVAARLAAHAVRADGLRATDRRLRTTEPRRRTCSASSGRRSALLAEAAGRPVDEWTVHGRGRRGARTTTTLRRRRAARPGRSRRSAPRSSGRATAPSVVRFTANWYCTPDVEPAWDLRPTGWRVRVRRRRAVRRRRSPFPIPLDDLGAFTPGVHRQPAGERDPVRVRGARPASSSTTDLPPITVAGPRAHAGAVG